VISPTDPSTLYVGSPARVEVDERRAELTRISPDLTPPRIRRRWARRAGDHEGQHRRRDVCHGVTIAPSPRDGGVIWAGSTRLRTDDAAMAARAGRRDRRRASAISPISLNRGVAVPRRHRLRGGQPVSAGRLQAVRLPHRRYGETWTAHQRWCRANDFGSEHRRRSESARGCCTSAQNTALRVVRRRREMGVRCGRTFPDTPCTTSLSKRATS